MSEPESCEVRSVVVELDVVRREGSGLLSRAMRSPDAARGFALLTVSALGGRGVAFSAPSLELSRRRCGAGESTCRVRRLEVVQDRAGHDVELRLRVFTSSWEYAVQARSLVVDGSPVALPALTGRSVEATLEEGMGAVCPNK